LAPEERGLAPEGRVGRPERADVERADADVERVAAGELRLQLMESGIDQDRIFVSCLDTFERREVCYSYRGGDREDRMFLHARLRPA